jgi:hypothetical protein
VNIKLLAATLAIACAPIPLLAADSPLQPKDLRRTMGLKLGFWRSTMTITEASAQATPGADPTVAASAQQGLREQVGKMTTVEECLWDRPDAIALPAFHLDAGCTVTRLQAANGHLGLAGSCGDASKGFHVDTTMSGTYTPDTLSIMTDIDTATGPVRLLIKAKIESRYVGACPAPPVVVGKPKP